VIVFTPPVSLVEKLTLSPACHAILDFELFGSAAGIGSDGAALRLLDRDRAADPVEFGNPSRQRLLSQSY
jgi:hypothetical protein